VQQESIKANVDPSVKDAMLGDVLSKALQKYDQENLTNPKFFVFAFVQNQIYVRVMELFNDPSNSQISSIPLSLLKVAIPPEIELHGWIIRRLAEGQQRAELIGRLFQCHKALGHFQDIAD
jgi:hypothetical protein